METRDRCEDWEEREEAGTKAMKQPPATTLHLMMAMTKLIRVKNGQLLRQVATRMTAKNQTTVIDPSAVAGTKNASVKGRAQRWRFIWTA